MQKTTTGKMVLIVGDTIDGVVSAGSRDLGGQARQLGEIFGAEPFGVLVGHDAALPGAARWSESAGIPATLLAHDQCRFPNPAATATALVDLVDELPPRAVCFPHGMRGCQAAATLASRLGWPVVTGVEAIMRSDDRLMFRRGILGGKVCQTVSPAGGPVVLTLMPGVFPKTDGTGGSQPVPPVEARRIQLADTRTVVKDICRQAESDQALEKARVVVAGGRGLGGPEGAGLLETVAGMFKRSAVGGSRGACDLGWLPHSVQIGETGRTVAPALYIACGISGASQHLAGMRGAQTILAVNTDPRAAILGVAHLAVIDDAKTFLPLLRQRYEETFNQGEGDDAHR